MYYETAPDTLPDETYNLPTKDEVWELAYDAFLENGAQYECVDEEEWMEQWVAKRYPWAL